MLKVSRILHAGYVFECEGVQIAFDPIFENPFSRNCHAFPAVQFDPEQIKRTRFAAVFISHFHDDHCSFESLDLLDRKTPLYIYCVFEELFDLIRELGFTQVYSLEIGKPLRIGPFEITPHRALDADVDSIFQIKAAGVNILNVVDSWIDVPTLNKLSQSAPWDMVLWPFQTMREIEVLAPSRASAAPKELPPEWTEQLKILNPRYIVPSSCQFVQESWSWYNHALFPVSYQQFRQEIGSALPKAEVIRLNPSVSIILDKSSLQLSSPLPWVKPMGEQDVDYDYRPDLKPPPTGEIAKHLAPLTSEQVKRVHEYCHSGLLEKFNSLDSSEDEYFKEPRLWRLAIYDHTGEATCFFYQLKADVMKLADESRDYTWSTEVPISKFYAALDLGESLTSMYMRINDVIFAPGIEEKIQHADILEDPLIRCLFTGVFGAYQKAQLKRLRALDL